MSHAAAVPAAPAAPGRRLAVLSLAALGVVYGDIGTSPLYAIKECFGPHGTVPTRENVIGVLSLILWSLNFVVSFKYIAQVMRADNRGEGGILALMALVRAGTGGNTRWRRTLILVGLFGAALLYGDGVITPAISVMGAIEGLTILTPTVSHWIVPVTVVILVLLFAFQSRGTMRVGKSFGPVMVVWFLAIAALGIHGIAMEPGVLAAVNPWHAVEYFLRHGVHGLVILGAVVLVFTGGEALYADMGHFGARPIRLAWYGFVLPALTLNYFGQGALLLRRPEAARNPFYELVPEPLLIPMLVVATAAAIVASQALISGAFSLTQQAVQLGYSPRVTIKHTFAGQRGQIYIPEVNWGLAVACVWLVLEFQSSSNLAAAYGVAVTGTMTITTILFIRVARDRWHWSRLKVALLGGLFLAVDLPYLGANMLKFAMGGWFPIAVGVVLFTLMTTWKLGRLRLSRIMDDNSLPIELFLNDVARRIPARVPGTAVFLTRSATAGAPPVLLHHVKHNKVLHEQVILLSIISEEVPHVDEDERITCTDLGQKFWLVQARYGFMESPNIPEVMQRLQAWGIAVRPMDTTYYLGRETLILTDAKAEGERRPGQVPGPKLSRWRKKLFVVMNRNAVSASSFFNLPPNRVVEMGAQIQF
ncbi:MAG TPA: potassium transporter Kup [Gemmatimonadales bacterium]|nr:potassium transporter Kup [Gemmatimonadales bacterium]